MNRLKKIVDYIEKKELDAILVTSEPNCHYVCGFSPSEGKILVSRSGAAFQFVDSRYTETAMNYAKENGLTVIETTKLSALNKRIRDLSIRSLGFESSHVSVDAFQTYTETFDAQLTPLPDFFMELRNEKDEAELALMKKAQEIAEKSFFELLELIRPGKTERELANELNYIMMKNDSHGPSFDTILISGANSSMPHGVPGTKPIERGDFITIDFGATYMGYHSDMTRTVAVGKATNEMKKVYAVVLEAQLHAIEEIAVGKSARDIYQGAFDIIDQAGYGAYFRHALGHGVGLEIHEGYSTPSERIYNAGYVTSVEPGIYIPGKFGVRIEDVLALGENGNTNLTHVPKELLIL